VNRRLSTAETARILGMREERIRELVRRGLGRPERRGRRYAFSFQDLVILRAAHTLIEQDVPAARVARALAALAEALPADRPLSGLRIRADGRGVVVRDEGTEWDPETGQTVLDFGIDELTARAQHAHPVRSFPERDPDVGSRERGPPVDERDRSSIRRSTSRITIRWPPATCTARRSNSIPTWWTPT
jgi:DNA-binding transcriptional MerR regulator